MSEEDLFQKFKLSAPEPMNFDIPVMVAEASSELGLIMVHCLEKAGFSKVRREKDGLLAIKTLEKQPATVLLASAELPSCSGLDLFKEIREDPKHQRGALILVTRPMSKAEVMLAVESGINELLVRPFTAGDIVPKIRTAYANFNNPKNPERIYEHAKQLLRAKNIVGAREVYQALADVNDKAARPHVGLARTYLVENNYEKALECATTAIKKNESFVHAYAVRAEIYLAIGKTDEAIVDLKKAVELSPLNIARLEHCCETLIKKGLNKQCAEILNRAIVAGLEHPYITERLGYCYFLDKDYQNALKYLKEAVRLEPENVTFLNSLAICHRDSKNYDEAIAMYNRIIKKDPENYQILFNKALVLTYKNANPEAAKLLRRVIQIHPEFEKAAQKLAELEKAGLDQDISTETPGET